MKKHISGAVVVLCLVLAVGTVGSIEMGSLALWQSWRAFAALSVASLAARKGGLTYL